MIREITNQEEWNTFLLEQQPNTFLQSWEWGQTQRADGEHVIPLGIFEEEKQVGAALVIIVHARRGRFLLCPHGPLFISEESSQKHFPKLAQELKKIAAEHRAVAIRIAPLALQDSAYKSTFAADGFRPAPLHIHADRTWVLDISASPEEILAGMRKTTRHAIRKAQELGVAIDIVKNEEILNRFWPLYTKTGTRHQFTPFSKDFLQAQLDSFGKTDRVYGVFAQHEGKDVAAAIMIQFGNTVFYHHGASANIPRGVPAAQLLHYASMQEAKRRGAACYNFWGIAPEDEPNHPFAGITVFKQGFGGDVFDYIPMQDLPVSFRYWKLWAIETWRKKKRGF